MRPAGSGGGAPALLDMGVSVPGAIVWRLAGRGGGAAVLEPTETEAAALRPAGSGGGAPVPADAVVVLVVLVADALATRPDGKGGGLEAIDVE